ncbi:MAG: TIGR04255 family protein [Sandaracinaceae bacterium]|nr:TIGR04255 family protein [Sandaracinaceae bacterium]
MTGRRLSKPPIVEALIDVRVAAREGGLGSLEEIHEKVKAEYPVKRGRALEHLQVAAKGDAKQITHTQELQGFAFVSADEKRIFQVRRDGITLNWVGDYDSWDALQGEAARLYPLYREAARPEAIEYLGVRYINRIRLPAGAQLEEWMSLRLTVPQALPQTLGDLQMRVLLPFGDDIVAMVISVLQPAEVGADWILDIEVRDMTKTPDSRPEAIWPKLVRLREVKNEIFFASTTERALESYR